MIENSIVYRDFRNKHNYLSISRAEGALIWDREGRRSIDFTSAWNVTNLGWNHPEVNHAVIDQAKKNVQGLLWGSDPIQEEYALELTASLPAKLDACIKATGGTEAIEVSLKIARVYTGRKKIVGFNHMYYGQLFAALALGSRPETHEKLMPLVPDITPIEFPHEDVGKEGFEKFAADLERLLAREDVAAVVTEPGIITGWGSTLIAHAGFLRKVREITEKYRTLLIVDEVGTGFSRTGKLFGMEHEGVVPDIIVCAKAISNGAAAIGAAVGPSALFEKAFADAIVISTFGWTPIACAAALATLRVHRREATWKIAEQKGAFIMEYMRDHIGGDLVGIRGKGLEIGLQFKDAATCERVQKAAFERGLHTTVGSGNNMQIMPPIIIPQDILEEGLEILVGGLNL